VLELEDLVDGPVDLDVVAVLELVRGDRGNQPPFARQFDVYDERPVTVAADPL
jgi:hypothetical protein